jgi:type III secretion system FlhB-like substrate exporter
MLESEIIKILKSKRFSLYNEKKLQEEIESAFIQHNIPANYNEVVSFRI